jgi:oxygen-independent coproporphyrinogen-3 oxidase
LTLTQEQRLIRELILQMKLGLVRDQYFKDKFGIRIQERFAGPVRILRDRGFLTTDADSLLLTRDGLLQVDRLLYEFFLPEHKLALTA